MRRQLSRTAAYAVMCSVAAVIGASISLRATSETETTTALGVVSADASLAPKGQVDAYVPLLDWGVRAEPYTAPVVFRLELRSLNRSDLVSALRSGDEAERRVEGLEGQLRKAIDRELRRSSLAALAGGATGGLFAGALVAAFARRRWLLIGPAVGLATTAALVGVTAVGLSRFDASTFRQPTFYARGSELPKLLAFSRQITETGERYTDSYEQALNGLAKLIAATSGPAPARGERTAIVASDLHSNALALDVLSEYTVGQTVFWVGDFTQLGSRYEGGIVTRITRSGSKVVAVSGNHDSRSFMRALAAEGATVLTSAGRLRADGTLEPGRVVEIDGLDVAGFSDPLETDGDGLDGHDLELTDEERREAEERFVAWFDGLPERPDVVLVHQHALAHALLDHVEDDEERLLVLTGHDHDQHLERAGRAVLVDGGTAGAGGPFAIGEQPAGFAQLHLTASGDVAAVDLIEVEPLSGSARAERVVIEPPPSPGGGRAIFDRLEQ